MRAWWTRFAGRVFWGVPTGRRSGIAVFDVDRSGDVDGFASVRERGLEPPRTRAHLTPRGGMHLIYKLADGETCPSDAGALGPGLDRRGDGGYIIWYPAHGGTIVETMEPQPAPSWLTMPVRTGKDAIRIVSPDDAEALLSSLMDDVRNAIEGERNATVSRSAFILGQLLQAGFHATERDRLASELIACALGIGLDQREAERAVLKGITRGFENPGFEETTAALWRAFGDPVQWTPRGLLEDGLDTLEASAPAVWLIRGVLEQNVHAMIHGAPNAGKSFVVIDWALSVACGVEWFGHKCTELPVVYVLGEGAKGFRRRVKAWVTDRGKRWRRGMFRWTRRAVAMSNAPDYETLCAEIDAGPRPGLIVVDTKTRATPGWDENTPVDSGRWIDLVGRLMDRYTCTVLVVHHTAKASGKSLGHTSILGAVDSELRVEGIGDGPPYRMCEVTVTKLKDGEPMAPKRFIFDDVTLPWFDDEGVQQRSAVLRMVNAVEGEPGAARAARKDRKRWTANDRLMLQAMGVVDASTVNDTILEYKTLRDAFMQLHGASDANDRRRAFDAAFDRAVERQWFDDKDEQVTPNVWAIRRDLEGVTGNGK